MSDIKGLSRRMWGHLRGSWAWCYRGLQHLAVCGMHVGSAGTAPGHTHWQLGLTAAKTPWSTAPDDRFLGALLSALHLEAFRHTRTHFWVWIQCIISPKMENHAVSICCNWPQEGTSYYLEGRSESHQYKVMQDVHWTVGWAWED